MGQINSNNDSTTGVVGEAVIFGAAAGGVVLGGLGAKKGFKAIAKAFKGSADDLVKGDSKYAKEVTKQTLNNHRKGAAEKYFDKDGKKIGEQMNFFNADTSGVGKLSNALHDTGVKIKNLANEKTSSILKGGAVDANYTIEPEKGSIGKQISIFEV